jgi:hypothetical protein
MFGFGILLMHLADYFARRKHDSNERIIRGKEEYQRKEVKQCLTCGDRFDNDMALKNHINQRHPRTSEFL